MQARAQEQKVIPPWCEKYILQQLWIPKLNWELAWRSAPMQLLGLTCR